LRRLWPPRRCSRWPRSHRVIPQVFEERRGRRFPLPMAAASLILLAYGIKPAGLLLPKEGGNDSTLGQSGRFWCKTRSSRARTVESISPSRFANNNSMPRRVLKTSHSVAGIAAMRERLHARKEYPRVVDRVKCSRPSAPRAESIRPYHSNHEVIVRSIVARATRRKRRSP
jgi:hypothetical protein